MQKEETSGNPALYIGFECRAQSDWKEYTTIPSPPKNYTKPDTIEVWKTKKIKELADDSKFLPLSGIVSRAYVIDENGTKQIDGSGGKVYSWLTTYCDKFKNFHASDVVTLIALNAKDRLRLCALNAIMNDKANTQTWGLFLNSYSRGKDIHDVVRIIDPISVVFGTTSDYDVNVTNMIAYMRQNDIECPTDLTSADSQAVFAKVVSDTFKLNNPLF